MKVACCFLPSESMMVTLIFFNMPFHCLMRLVVPQRLCHILATEEGITLLVTHGADSSRFLIPENLNCVSHNRYYYGVTALQLENAPCLLRMKKY